MTSRIDIFVYKVYSRKRSYKNISDPNLNKYKYKPFNYINNSKILLTKNNGITPNKIKIHDNSFIINVIISN